MNVEFTTSDTTTTHIFIAIPEGPLIKGRVKEVVNVEAYPDEVHPGKPHTWRELDHYGQFGTGFAQCLCGAIGIPFR